MLFDFQFENYGATKAPQNGTGHLYLDVGGNLGEGVIDHHQLIAYTGSATSLVLDHPELVQAAIDPSSASLTIHLHREPDFDCLCAAFLAQKLVGCGKFPKGSGYLGKYADMVDQGCLGVTQSNPFSLYAALAVLHQRLGPRTWRSQSDCWSAIVRRGLEVVSHVLEKSAAGGLSLPEVDAFDCPGIFGPVDRKWVGDDLARYEAKISSPAAVPRIGVFKFPDQFGGV
jgi:hypothetical protein